MRKVTGNCIFSIMHAESSRAIGRWARISRKWHGLLLLTLFTACGDSGSGNNINPSSPATTPPTVWKTVRLGDQCYTVCQSNSDPEGDGWGWENHASCIMPDNPSALTAPWCDTPVPLPSPDPVPALVDASVISVATLPRPEYVPAVAPTNCPHHQVGLDAWNPDWLGVDGIVSVPAGKRVLVNGNSDIPSGVLIRRLTIPATSEVIFADQPATFRVTDVRVQGALRMGSPTCRLQSEIALVFDTDEAVGDAVIRQQIFTRAGLGIVVEAGGRLDVFGKRFQPTWTRLAATAAKDSNSIQLAEPVDWEAGQKLVIVTSQLRDYPYSDENEVRTIVSVSADRKTIVLDTPLAYLHYGGWEYQVEVGLLTRNIVLRTADAVLAAAPTFGGHVMVHGGQGRVSGAELYAMGQQNFKGRYPLHMHQLGDVAGASYFTDNSIWRSNWRCAVIHRTDRALVSRNVAFDMFGHCFYIEDGVELGNEVSFNLAARVKIMGATDAGSLAEINTYAQEGFVLLESAAFSNPADRAAAGFYITNGNNRVIGNAASGGFAGYSLPNLMQAIGGSNARIYPTDYGISEFDGNSAHTAGYLWDKGGCVYAGGLLEEIDDGGVTKLRYQSGRTPWTHARRGLDVFSNTKTFLCTVGITHWGNRSRVVNFEAWDAELMAKLFGSASIHGALFAGQTGNTANLTFGTLGGYRRGFQFYDTWTLTVLRRIQFRDIHASPYAGTKRSENNCALYSMTHSDQFTPQRMSTTAELYFVNVDESQRICHDDTGTLASRNFNLIDADGTATGFAGDGLPGGPRLVGSAYAGSWQTATDCVRHDIWGLWICPQRDPQNIASIGVFPNRDVQVKMYRLDGTPAGENRYSGTEFAQAQISGPSGIGWHHVFPGGIPDRFDVWALQVPQGSFALLSVTLPRGVSCAVTQGGWLPRSDLTALLASNDPGYTTQYDTCFVRVPWTDIGSFNAAGLSIPAQAWQGFSTTTNFTVVTGCTNSNPECASVPQTLPSLP